MRKMYEYKGNISSSGNNEIVLYVMGNDEVPPTKLTVPKALFQYVEDICGRDSEEKYYDKIYKYDHSLILHEIVIPSQNNGKPAKIITQAKLTSEEVTIFGEVEQMETLEEELMPMNDEEYWRYYEFRRENEHERFYYA